MNEKDVVELIKTFTDAGVAVWIDGGWGVDALIGRQTREHTDLDVAVHRKDTPGIRGLLEHIGYREIKRADSSEYIYFMQNEAGNGVDIHTFAYDVNGHNTYGVKYPFGSLAGTGTIGGRQVNCISPAFMLCFKTGYEPKEKDILDVQALCKAFGFDLPCRYANRKSFIIIETARLILRPLTLDNAETAYNGWTGDEEVARYVSWLPHHSIDETIKWLKEVEWKRDEAGDILPNDNYIWGFVLKETGELFGSGGLIWEEGCRLYQVGYNIMKSHWNHGYTTEAMRAILRYAVENLGLKRIAGGHAKENLASAKVIEKLGFVYDRDDITPHVDGIHFFDSREYYLDLEM